MSGGMLTRKQNQIEGEEGHKKLFVRFQMFRGLTREVDDRSSYSGLIVVLSALGRFNRRPRAAARRSLLFQTKFAVARSHPALSMPPRMRRPHHPALQPVPLHD